MKRQEGRRDRHGSGARMAASVLAGLAALVLAAHGCGGVTVDTGGSGDQCTTSVVIEPFTRSSLDKIDLLLGMAGEPTGHQAGQDRAV